MGNAGWIVPVLLLAAVAGCLGGDTDPSEDAPGVVQAAETAGPHQVPDGLLLEWELVDCTYVVTYTYVDASRLEPYLPPGFEPRQLALDALPVNAQGDTMFGMDAMVCRAAPGISGGNGPLYSYGMLWADAAPPGEVAIPGIENYVQWDTLVTNETSRAVLAERGIPVRSGEARVDLSFPAGTTDVGAGTLEASLSLDDVGAFEVTGTLSRPRGSPSGDFVKFTPADGGVAGWRAAYETQMAWYGQGTLAFEPGSWAAEVAGSTTMPAEFHTGTWSYPDGEVRLVQYG